MATPQPQDEYFNDFVKKTYEEMKFSESLYQRVNISKINLEMIKSWINKKITDCLHVENKVVTDFVCNQLQKEKFPCPKNLHISMMGFLTAPQAQKFMDELWALLVSAEESENGIPAECLEQKDHKTAEKVSEKQEQQISQSSSNSNETCNSNNKNNKNSPLMECQSTPCDKSEPSDGEIVENSLSRSCSRDRSERKRSSPDRKLNDSNEKQSQRRTRYPCRRSPEPRNQQYRFKHRNTRRYESPQRRRDISRTPSRQSRSRFVEKLKTSSSTSKRNRSKSWDSYHTQNGSKNGETVATNHWNPFNKRSKEDSNLYLRSESRSTYRSSSKHSNYERRAFHSVSFTSSPERIQYNRGYNRDYAASSLEEHSGRFEGARRNESPSSSRGFEYNRYRPYSPDRHDRYNRQELRARQRTRSRSRSLRRRSRSQRRSHSSYRQRSFSRNHSHSPRRTRSPRRSRPHYRQRSIQRYRSRSPRRFNDRRWPLQFHGNNRRRSNSWNRKTQGRERFRGHVNRYDHQRYISPERRFSRERRLSPRRKQFCRNSRQRRDSPQRLSPEKRFTLRERNIFSPLQISTPEYEDSTCNSWNQLKNSVGDTTPNQSPSLSSICLRKSDMAETNKRKYCDLEDGNLKDYVTDAKGAVNSKKRKTSKHNSDDNDSKKRSSKKSNKIDKKCKEENKEAKILDSDNDDNMEDIKNELSWTESIMLGNFD